MKPLTFALCVIIAASLLLRVIVWAFSDMLNYFYYGQKYVTPAE
jgi:hypothetical protein